MNPYEATLPNVLARVVAWVRGIMRRYRKPLVVVGAAAATLGLSISASQAPARSAAHPPTQIAAAAR